jgi:hypothetical protein
LDFLLTIQSHSSPKKHSALRQNEQIDSRWVDWYGHIGFSLESPQRRKQAIENKGGSL